MKEKEAMEEKKSTVKEIVKDGTGLGFLKVLGTALTAVSMAVISAKITGFVNSLMLVAILSIGTALVNEFYRIILSFTSLGAKKIVAPVLKTTKNAETGEIIIVEEEPIIINSIEEVEEKEESEKSTFSIIKSKTIRYFKNNSVMRFILIFATVALITIGINYLVKPDQEPTVYKYTTNHTTEQQVIEEPSDEPIVEEKTTVIVKEQETDVDDEQTPPTTTPSSPTTEIPLPTAQSTDNNDAEIQELITRIETLEQENTTLKDDLKKLQEQQSTEDTPTTTEEDSVSIEEMNKQVQELQKQIDELKNNSNGNSSTNELNFVQENRATEDPAMNN